MKKHKYKRRTTLLRVRTGIFQLGVIATLLLTLLPASADTAYYVAPEGSDVNDGKSVGRPFRSIAAAATVMLPGDTCYLRAGVYRETLVPAASGTEAKPITFTAYNGEHVTISAADLVEGWSAYSNSIYVAGINWDLGAGFNQLFVNGVMVNEARWPNTGTDLLNSTLASGSATANGVTFPVSRPANYWAGGTVYGCFGSKWTSQGGTITASTTGGELTVTAKTSTWYTGGGNGYITGIFGELDSTGEWFLSGTTLYLWAPGSVDPATVTVEFKARKWCVNLSGKSYVKIRDLNLLGGSIRMDASNCEVSGCTAKYLSHFTKYTWGGMDAGGDRANGNNGVWINGDNNVISNCTFKYSAGSGILVYGARNTVTRSIISEIDYSGTYSCPLSVKNSTGGNRILFNTMYNTGRDIVQLYGATADEIMYNNLYSAGKICHDLGIVYHWGRDGQATRIAYNWIHDNLGGGPGPGIYHDNYCRDFITDHNVIWNCEAGVRLNTPTDAMQVYNNTLFNCDDVGTHTYNAWQNNVPSYWTYGNINNSVRANNLFLGTNPSAQLQDYANNDFRLKAGAAAIDVGTVVVLYTDGYQGVAPDQGAYEDGCSRWTAGHDGVAVVVGPPSGISLSYSAVEENQPSGTTVGIFGTTGGMGPYTYTLVAGDGSTDNASFAISGSVLRTAASFDFEKKSRYTIRVQTQDANTDAFQKAFTIIINVYETVTTFLVDTAAIGTSGDSDFYIKTTAVNSLVDTTELIAGNPNSSTGKDQRAYLKFDLSGLTTMTTVTSAVLRLWWKTGSNDKYGNANVFARTAAFVPGGSSDYAELVGTSLGTIAVLDCPSGQWKELNVTAAVEGWRVSGLSTYYGFAIQGTEGYTLTGKYFDSRTGTHPPQLVVWSRAKSAQMGTLIMLQ